MPGSYEEFRQELDGLPVEDLIARFNREVGITAWVAARANYLIALRDAFLASDLDCSSFIHGDAMSLARHIRRDGACVALDGSDPGTYRGTVVRCPRTGDA